MISKIEETSLGGFQWYMPSCDLTSFDDILSRLKGPALELIFTYFQNI